VLVVWVAQKQHEDAALHHDFGGKLHMQTCALGLVQRHHLPIGSVKPDPKGDFVSNSDSRAAAAAAGLKACAARTGCAQHYRTFKPPMPCASNSPRPLRRSLSSKSHLVMLPQHCCRASGLVMASAIAAFRIAPAP
jgi:hypothetical protein